MLYHFHRDDADEIPSLDKNQQDGDADSDLCGPCFERAFQ